MLVAIMRGLAFVCSSDSAVRGVLPAAAGGTSGQPDVAKEGEAAAAAVRRQAQAAFLGLLGHRLPGVQLTTLALLRTWRWRCVRDHPCHLQSKHHMM